MDVDFLILRNVIGRHAQHPFRIQIKFLLTDVGNDKITPFIGQTQILQVVHRKVFNRKDRVQLAQSMT